MTIIPTSPARLALPTPSLEICHEARAWYTKALAADPNHIATLGNSGALYVTQGDLAKARGELDRIKAVCGGTTCREYSELESLIAAKGR